MHGYGWRRKLGAPVGLCSMELDASTRRVATFIGVNVGLLAMGSIYIDGSEKRGEAEVLHRLARLRR